MSADDELDEWFDGLSDEFLSATLLVPMLMVMKSHADKRIKEAYPNAAGPEIVFPILETVESAALQHPPETFIAVVTEGQGPLSSKLREVLTPERARSGIKKTIETWAKGEVGEYLRLCEEKKVEGTKAIRDFIFHPQAGILWRGCVHPPLDQAPAVLTNNQRRQVVSHLVTFKIIPMKVLVDEYDEIEAKEFPPIDPNGPQPPRTPLQLKKALKDSNVYFREHYSCCRTCGVDEICRERKAQKKFGFCFYHGQDTDTAARTGRLNLSFGPVDGDETEDYVKCGQTVANIAQLLGYCVNWDGSARTRIILYNMDPEYFKRKIAKDEREEEDDHSLMGSLRRDFLRARRAERDAAGGDRQATADDTKTDETAAVAADEADEDEDDEDEDEEDEEDEDEDEEDDEKDADDDEEDDANEDEAGDDVNEEEEQEDGDDANEDGDMEQEDAGDHEEDGAEAQDDQEDAIDEEEELNEEAEDGRHGDSDDSKSGSAVESANATAIEQPHDGDRPDEERDGGNAPIPAGGPVEVANTGVSKGN